MKTRVVNIRKESYDIYIGRPGKGLEGYFGNPIPLTCESERYENVCNFKEYFLKRIETDPEYKIKVESLKGKLLGCFCKPKICHGDVYVEYLEDSEIEEYISLF